ncbi:MAG TPA: nuclear transport factor 2 family protein [Candidatus Cloacimonadota bacterium]|nr:nuclear transport factor 2 family protein [Candidatus Cloacimonadota bacterium]
MRYLIPILLVLSMLNSSCGISDPQIGAEQEIRDLIYDVTQAYNWGDIDAIMELVHPEFRHEGMYSLQLRQLWLDRLARFPLLETNVTSVKVNGDYAVAHFSMLLTSSTESILSTEPQDNGDLSYFFYDSGKWQIYGDQGWIK